MIYVWYCLMMNMIAGVFLYVALVDMMPELSSGHTHPLSKEQQTEGHVVAVLLQVSRKETD